MPYQVISQDQFKKLRDNGYSVEKIAEFEKKRMAESGGTAVMEEPQEELKESAGRTFYRERIAPAVEGASTLAFGIPKAAMQYQVNKETPGAKQAYEAMYPEQRTTSGKALRAGAEIAGFFGGGSGRLAASAGRKVGGKILKGATEGAVAGGTQVTGAEDSFGGQALRQAGQAVGGAAVGAAMPVVKNIFTALHRATKGQVPFAGRVREAFINKKVEAIKGFGDDLERYTKQYPDRSISLSEIMKEAQATSPYDQKLNSFIKSNEQLRKLVDNPELANNMPIGEVQTLLNKINPKIQGKYGSDFLEVKDFIHDIKAAQLDAFPEMAQTKEAYAKIAEPYRLIKSKIKEGSLLKNLANKFGDPELNARAESLMGSDIKAEVDSYRKTKKMLGAMGIMGKTAGAGVAGGAGYKMLTGN